MPVEVPCPGCGMTLKTPENMAGKKARCRKCLTPFRVPGLPPAAESVGDGPFLSAAARPAPLSLDDDDPPPPAPAPAPKARDVSSLPSVDPFDFAAPPPPKPTAAKPAPAAPAAAPRPAFEAAKSSPPAAAQTPPAPAVKAAAKPGPPPAADPLPLDDEPETTPNAAAADATDPFSFDAPGTGGPKAKPRRRDRDEDEDDDRPRRRGRRDEDDEDDDRDAVGPRYRRPGDRGAGNTLLYAGIVGVVALVAAVAAVVVYINQKREAEQARAEKEKPPPDPPKDDAKDGKKDKDPKDKDPKEPPKKDPKEGPKKEPVDPVPAAAPFDFPKGTPSVQFRREAPKAVIQTPGDLKVAVDAAAGAVRRAFPAEPGAGRDTVVVWVTNPGVGGKGQRAAAQTYSPTVGSRTGKPIEFDGDGVRCDVSPDGKRFAAAGPDGRVTVWGLEGGEKVVDGFDPYADPSLSDHKKAGLAAVFFTRTSGLLTVSTAGVVHLFDPAGRGKDGKPYVQVTGPTGVSALVPNKVAAGRNVAVDDTRSTLVLAAYGSVWRVDTGEKLEIKETKLGGEVARPLGLGVSVGNPGHVAFAFETGRKEKGLMLCAGQGKPEFHRLDPADEPAGVDWIGTAAAVVATARGALWVEYDAGTKRLLPFALAEVPGGKGVHAATEGAHWYLVPDPAKPTGSVLLSLSWPPNDNLDFRREAVVGGPLHVLRLDHNGLSR